MIQLALRLAELSANGLKALARAFKTGLTGHTVFTTPKFTPVQLEAGAKAVDDQEGRVAAAVLALTAERTALQVTITTLEDMLTAVATDCLNTVSTLPEVQARAALQSANIPLRGDAAPLPPAGRPTTFSVNRSDEDGAVDGGCDRDKAAKFYRVQAGRTPTGPMTTKYEGSKSSFTIRGLEPGLWYFQMSAFGTNGGWSSWTEVVACTVV